VSILRDTIKGRDSALKKREFIRLIMRKSVLNSDNLDVDYKGPVPDYKYILDTQPTVNP